MLKGADFFRIPKKRHKKPDKVKDALGCGAIFLVFYPPCLLANVMSLAGHKDDSVPFLFMLIVYCVLWGLTAYPLVYLLGAGVSLLMNKKGNKNLAIRFAQLPLVYLLFMIFLIIAWIAFSVYFGG